MIFGRKDTKKKPEPKPHEADVQTRAVEIVYCSDISMITTEFEKASTEVRAAAKTMAKDMVPNLELRLEALRKILEA